MVCAGQAGLIVCYSGTGRTASLIAKYRPTMPIMALVVPRLHHARWGALLPVRVHPPEDVRTVSGSSCAHGSAQLQYAQVLRCHSMPFTLSLDCSCI